MSFGQMDSKNKSPMVEINVTPFVDVMLVLLVIFILTAPLLTQSIQVNLPATAPTQQIQKLTPVEIGIDVQNRIFWNKEMINKIELETRLKALATTAKDTPLHIRADKDCKYETVAAVMGAAQSVGLSQLGLVSVSNN